MENRIHLFGSDEKNGRLCSVAKPSVRLCSKRTTVRILFHFGENMSVMDSIGTKLAKKFTTVIWSYNHIWSLVLSHCVSKIVVFDMFY